MGPISERSEPAPLLRDPDRSGMASAGVWGVGVWGFVGKALNRILCTNLCSNMGLRVLGVKGIGFNVHKILFSAFPQCPTLHTPHTRTRHPAPVGVYRLAKLGWACSLRSLTAQPTRKRHYSPCPSARNVWKISLTAYSPLGTTHFP